MNFRHLQAQIRPLHEEAGKDCAARLDQVAKPLGSLGKLEALLIQIAAITGSAEIELQKKGLVVFCADNGVIRQGVSQNGHEVTTAIAGMLSRGKSSVSVMARSCGADLFVVDMGMVDTVHGLIEQKLMQGTNDMTQGPAMSRETAEKAIRIGMDMVRDLQERGYRLLASGETGIGNTTTSSAVCSVLLQRSVLEVTGRGAGLDDAGLARKVAAIEKAIRVNKPDPADPLDVLHKLGGLDMAALVGLFLGGAKHGVPIVMDGFISGVAALTAVRLCPAARPYILPSHVSAEPGAHLLLADLALSPLIHADMRLGEGTGAVALFPLLDMALAVYRDTATYAEIQVEQYRRST